MFQRHDKATIISMAVIASAAATLLHEGLGHGVTASLRGDIVTELTSNHLSAVYPDKLVSAGGTLVNLSVGTAALLVSRNLKERGNPRYFFWLLAALNLLPGAGYFLFSGLFGFGDWNHIIRSFPYEMAWRAALMALGAVLYFVVVQQLAISVQPFVPQPAEYNTVGRLPYLVAGLFSCAAGALDPLGLKLLLVSTIPAAFGGLSGLLWADSLIPYTSTEPHLAVHGDFRWWVAAAVLGIAFIVILGPGVQFTRH